MSELPEWIVREHDGDPVSTRVHARDEHDAAQEAVEGWYERGMWDGEEIPHRVEVQVMRANGGVWRRVDVVVGWSPMFTGVNARPSEEGT